MEIPVVFTLTELWLLNDVVRHDEERGDEREQPRYPLVSTRLNEEIALAINTCMTVGMTEQTILLSYAELLLIDAGVRRGMKTPEGAKGSEILLKTFAARARLSAGFLDLWPTVSEENDVSYSDALALTQKEEVNQDAVSDDDSDTDKDPDPDPAARPRAARRSRKAPGHDLPPTA